VSPSSPSSSLKSTSENASRPRTVCRNRASAQCVCYGDIEGELIRVWLRCLLNYCRRGKINWKIRKPRAALNFIPKLALLRKPLTPRVPVHLRLMSPSHLKYYTAADIARRQMSPGVNCRQFYHGGSIKTYDDIIKNPTRIR